MSSLKSSLRNAAWKRTMRDPGSPYALGRGLLAIGNVPVQERRSRPRHGSAAADMLAASESMRHSNSQATQSLQQRPGTAQAQTRGAAPRAAHRLTVASRRRRPGSAPQARGSRGSNAGTIHRAPPTSGGRRFGRLHGQDGGGGGAVPLGSWPPGPQGHATTAVSSPQPYRASADDGGGGGDFVAPPTVVAVRMQPRVTERRAHDIRGRLARPHSAGSRAWQNPGAAKRSIVPGPLAARPVAGGAAGVELRVELPPPLTAKQSARARKRWKQLRLYLLVKMCFSKSHLQSAAEAVVSEGGIAEERAARLKQQSAGSVDSGAATSGARRKASGVWNSLRRITVGPGTLINVPAHLASKIKSSPAVMDTRLASFKEASGSDEDSDSDSSNADDVVPVHVDVAPEHVQQSMKTLVKSKVNAHRLARAISARAEAEKALELMEADSDGSSESSSGSDDFDGGGSGERTPKRSPSKRDLRREGSMQGYSLDALAERVNLPEHPDIVAAILKFWYLTKPDNALQSRVSGGKLGAGTPLQEDDFLRIMRPIHTMLIGDAADEDERSAEIIADWMSDSVPKHDGTRHMPYSVFHVSMFEIADQFVPVTRAANYIRFLERLFAGIADVSADGVPVLRSSSSFRSQAGGNEDAEGAEGSGVGGDAAAMWFWGASVDAGGLRMPLSVSPTESLGSYSRRGGGEDAAAVWFWSGGDEDAASAGIPMWNGTDGEGTERLTARRRRHVGKDGDEIGAVPRASGYVDRRFSPDVLVMDTPTETSAYFFVASEDSGARARRTQARRLRGGAHIATNDLVPAQSRRTGGAAPPRPRPASAGQRRREYVPPDRSNHRRAVGQGISGVGRRVERPQTAGQLRGSVSSPILGGTQAAVVYATVPKLGDDVGQDHRGLRVSGSNVELAPKLKWQTSNLSGIGAQHRDATRSSNDEAVRLYRTESAKWRHTAVQPPTSPGNDTVNSTAANDSTADDRRARPRRPAAATHTRHMATPKDAHRHMYLTLPNPSQGWGVRLKGRETHGRGVRGSYRLSGRTIGTSRSMFGLQSAQKHVLTGAPSGPTPDTSLQPSTEGGKDTVEDVPETDDPARAAITGPDTPWDQQAGSATADTVQGPPPDNTSGAIDSAATAGRKSHVKGKKRRRKVKPRKVTNDTPTGFQGRRGHVHRSLVPAVGRPVISRAALRAGAV